MYRINLLVSLALLTTFSNAYANETVDNGISLKLQCNISFSNFDNIAHTAKTEELVLTNFKHKPGGMKLVTHTSDYEFWVMTHGIQTINSKRFVANFQVAIKHKASNLFMHALSDSNHNPEAQPKHARISLIKYHPESSIENGELFFECGTFD